MSSKIRVTRSSSALIPTTGDQKRILPNHELSFRTVYCHENPGRASRIEQDQIYILHQASSSLDCEGPPSSFTSRTQSTPAAVIPDVDSTHRVQNPIRQVVAEEVVREHAKLLPHVTQQALQNALLNIFSTGYTEAKEDWRSLPIDLFKRFSPTFLKRYF